MGESPQVAPLPADQVLEAAPVGLLEIDGDGRILQTNRTLDRLLGYPPGTLIGRPVELLVPEQLRARHVGLRTQYQHAPALRQMACCREIAARRRDGSALPVEIWLGPLDGGPRVLASVVDIAGQLCTRPDTQETQPTCRQSALRLCDIQLRLVTDRVPVLLSRLDRDGRYRYVNERYEDWFGIPVDRIVGLSMAELLGEPAAEALRPHVDAVLRGEDVEFEGELRPPGGRTRWVLARYVPDRTPAGRIDGFFCMVLDLTDRRRHEQQQHRLLADLEAFSHAVFHDLAGPLRRVRCYAELLERKASPPDALQRIHASLDRMGELLDGLRKLASLSVAPPAHDPVDLSELAHEIARELAAEEPQRTVRFECPAGLVAMGDRRLMRILLENLLQNAWKFTRLRPDARVELSTAPERRGTVFQVRDNGVGFDPSCAQKLFEPFQRGRAGAGFDGQGIGLATVARIVHAHGGKIWAEGAPGEGACFRFTLWGS